MNRTAQKVEDRTP